MPDMDRMLGPWRLRVWGLVVNLLANALALAGIVRVVRGGSAWLLTAGVALTALCLATLAVPPRAKRAVGRE